MKVKAEVPRVLADPVEVASEHLGQERAIELLVDAAQRAGVDLQTVGGKPVSEPFATGNQTGRDRAIGSIWMHFWWLYLDEAPGLFPGHEELGPEPGADVLPWLHARREGRLDPLELSDEEVARLELMREIVAGWLEVELKPLTVSVPREDCRELRGMNRLLGYGLWCLSGIPELRGEVAVSREALEVGREAPSEVFNLPLSLVHEELHVALAEAACPGVATSRTLLARLLDESIVTTTECALAFALDAGVEIPTLEDLEPFVERNGQWKVPFKVLSEPDEFDAESPISAVLREWRDLSFQIQRTHDEQAIARLLNERFGEDRSFDEWQTALSPYP